MIGTDYPGFPAAESIDYSDTATLLSIQGVDANNNVIPGIVLEGGDGSILGSASATATPEPSTLLMMGSGILGLAGIFRRKLSL